MSKIRFVGLDVHADTIAVAVAEPDNGEVRSLGVILNQPEHVRKLFRKLGPAEHLRACYEAGPTGYGLYWQLTELGVNCAVIAPTLTPTKPGDRVKTNRRDAQKLARCHRAGDLTPVWVPDAAHEALRDLVRAREDAREDQQRARHRLGKFLLRHGWQRPKDIKENWTQKHMAWIKSQVRFEQPASQAAFLDYVHEVEHAADRLQAVEKAIDDAIAAAPAEIQQVVQALQSLRGVGKIVAATVVAEVGSLSRFRSPRQLMSYAGVVSSEYSSGNRIHRGAITKTGNAHLRRVLVEAAWAYQHKPWIGGWLAKRQQGLDQETKDIAWKAQWRLCTRYKKLAARGKNKPQIVTAIGRELLGFIWAIAVRAETRAAARAA
jgi:transposase